MFEDNGRYNFARVIFAVFLRLFMRYHVRVIKCNRALREIMLRHRIWSFYFAPVDDRGLSIVSLREEAICSNGMR